MDAGHRPGGWNTIRRRSQRWARRQTDVAAPLELRYQLAAQLAGARSSQTYAALLAEIAGGVGAHTQLTFSARAEHPIRISVQLRNGVSGQPEERWQRSVYVDTVERDDVVRFDDLTPVGDTRSRHPAINEIRYVLFVVDTTNTKPGSSGRVWIRGAALQR